METYYFFEYVHPRTKRINRTAWRMTIEYAAEHYPAYRPIMSTAQVRATLSVCLGSGWPTQSKGEKKP